MQPLDDLATRQVDVRGIRRSLALTDARARTEGVLAALSWNQPGAEVEWAPLPHGIGRFTLGNSPTSASVVAPPDAMRDAWHLAWHAGFRWCVSTSPGALEWVDVEHGQMWRGTGEGLNERALSGLTARGFARTARMEPREVSFEPVRHPLVGDPSQHIASRIKQWWGTSCQHHLTERSSREEKDGHQDRFTRFVAGVLLLRTIEDMDRVAWLPRGKLREIIRGKAPIETFRELIGRAATRLNSRVIRGMARDLHADVVRRIVHETYELDVDFAELDVDPVGAFYEDILGVEYEHEAKPNLDLFGENLDIRADRSARRVQGVYYTPRIYADTLARKLVRPAARAAESVDELPIVADIAVGSGELLCAALREILAEPAWKRADVAWQVLDSKLYGVDKNPLAPQLAALNLLRTAIRYVPELLDEERRLPPMDRNLRRGDALTQRTIDALPRPDLVLINPPFSTPNRWHLDDPTEAIPELSEVQAHPNKALAFFAAAVRLAKPGTGLGVVLPSSVLTGPLSAPWRRWLAERVRLDLVVANYGTPFRGAFSYAGLVVAEKLATSDQWRPRTRVVRVSGSIDEEMDTGVLLSEAGDSHGIAQHVSGPIRETTPDWLGHESRSEQTVRAASGRRALRAVMGDTFHQGVALAPQLWGADLFLFERLPNGHLKHMLSGKTLGPLQTPYLRPLAKAKRLSPRVPLWCEPTVDDILVFLPPGGGDHWHDISHLRDEDRAAWSVAEVVRDAIKHTNAASFKPESYEADFAAHAEVDELRFCVSRGYKDEALTLVYASRATVTARSRGQGRAWYAWVNLTGAVVPVSGIQMRVARPVFAAALVAWMSLEDVIAPLIEQAAPRRDGSVELNLESVARWHIPDLRDDRHQAHLDELWAAFLDYREEATARTPTEALALPSYREVQRLALALWEDA